MAGPADVVDLSQRMPTREEITSAAEAATVLAKARPDNGTLDLPGG